MTKSVQAFDPEQATALESVPSQSQLDEFLATETANERERLIKEKAQRETEQSQKIAWARALLKIGDWVDIPKFGQTGQISRIDQRKRLALVQVGLGQWEMSLDDVLPKERAM